MPTDILQYVKKVRVLTLLSLAIIMWCFTSLFCYHHILMHHDNQQLNDQPHQHHYQRHRKHGKAETSQTSPTSPVIRSMNRSTEATQINQSPSSPPRDQCLSFDNEREMDNLISNSKQIFIAMPTKAAGSSLRSFINDKCMKYRANDFFFRQQKLGKLKFIQNSLEIPKVVASHVFKDEDLIHLVQHMTRNSLLIYVHREESDRMISAIQHVVRKRLCSSDPRWTRSQITSNQNRALVSIEGGTCTITEDDLLNHVITDERNFEMGNGAPDILTCDFYKAVREHAPNIVFVNYQQADRLMGLIAKHHCPDKHSLASLHDNTKERNGFDRNVFVELSNNKEQVELSDWLEKKREVLEWATDLRKNASCQRQIKMMEESLFTCPQEAVQLRLSFDG